MTDQMFSVVNKCNLYFVTWRRRAPSVAEKAAWWPKAHMRALHIKWKGQFSTANPSVTVWSMNVSVFKILEHSIFQNSHYHWGAAEKSLLCLLNAKRLLDCSFSLCFVCLLASTENTLTVLQFCWEKNLQYAQRAFLRDQDQAWIKKRKEKYHLHII